MRLAIDRGRNAMSLGIDSSSRYPTPLRRSAAFDERGDLQLASGERRPIVAGCILPHEMQTECERLRWCQGLQPDPWLAWGWVYFRHDFRRTRQPRTRPVIAHQRGPTIHVG